MKRALYFCLLVSLITYHVPRLYAARAEIRNSRFYVDGEPFYVKGVGYAPWRPHQRPGVSYVDTNRGWTELDFERIKAAHFNTVRTWDALDPEELALAQKNGLMVLQGIALDPRQDFSDPHNQQSCLAQVQRVAEASKPFDNVLGYLIMTEPSPQVVVDVGAAQTLQFFRGLKRAIQAIDPRPVSMNSWVPLLFLDHGDFDFVTFNAFAFWPKSLNHALGYAGLNRVLADRFASNRPLVIGETGGYAVSKASQSAAGGFGGFSEYDQSMKDLENLRATVEGHASGSVLVSWIDPWYNPRDPDTHDDEPWEWSGILGIPTDSKKDMKGIPRQIYRDVTAYNTAIILEPKVNHFYEVQTAIPIQVQAAENVKAVRFSLNDSDWLPLAGSGHGWWNGFFKMPKLARKRQRLAIQAINEQGTVLVRKEVSFVAALTPELVTIDAPPDKSPTKSLQFTVFVTDGQRHPLVQRKVHFGFFYPLTLREAQGTAVTDASGRLTLTCPIPPQSADRYLYVAAGTDSPERVRSGDLRIFSLR